MAEEEVGLRLSLKNRREVATGVRQVGDELDRVGDQAAQVNRQSRIASRGIAGIGRAGRTAGRIAAVGIAAVTGAAVAAGYAAVRLARSSISQASDLNESLNAVNVTYGKQAKAVKRLGREAAKSLGLSNVEFNGLAVRFSAFATTIGGEGKGVVKTLDTLTTRASDFASVMNLEVAEAADLFQSGLAGETEPLRKYGIDLSAAKVEAFALSEGIVKNKDDLTEAAKVQARYQLLMQQTSKTQGDFRNTSDSLANSQRILSARWDNAQAKLGKALLPMMEIVVGYLLREGIPAFNRFSDWFTTKGLPAIQDFVSKAAPKVKSFIGKFTPLARELLPEVWAGLKKVAGWAETGAGYATDLVKAFKDMPEWAKTLLIGGGVAAWALPKIPGVNPAASMAVKAVGVQKVFETNPAALGGGPSSKVPPIVPAVASGSLAALGLTAGFITQGVLGTWLGDTVIRKATGSDAVANNNTVNKGVGGGSGLGLDQETNKLFDGIDDNDPALLTDYVKAVGTLKPTALQAASSMGSLNKGFRDLMLEAGVAKTKVVGLDSSLTDVASQHPTPEVVVTGIPKASGAVDDFVRGPLKALEQPRSARIDANVAPALAQVNYLDRMIAGLSRTVTTDLAPRGFGGARAKGGPVDRTKAYLVGENGPELFRPTVNGFVHPGVPDMPRFDDEDWGADGGGGGVTSPVTLEVVLQVDRREIARAVIDDFENRMARA